MSAPELAALVDASNHLRNLQQKLSRVQRPAPPIPAVSSVPGRVDDRYTLGSLTKIRKSALPPLSFNKFPSEAYPLAAPYVYIQAGTNSRHIGRDPVVAWR